MTSKRIRSVAADSNVLLSAVIGKAARRVFLNAPELVVVTTEHNLAEVEEYLPELANRYGLEIKPLLAARNRDRCQIHSSQELHKLFDRESCLPKDGTQCSSVELAMIGNDELGERLVTAQNHMTRLLAANGEPGARERIDAFTT